MVNYKRASLRFAKYTEIPDSDEDLEITEASPPEVAESDDDATTTSARLRARGCHGLASALDARTRRLAAAKQDGIALSRTIDAHEVTTELVTPGSDTPAQKPGEPVGSAKTTNPARSDELARQASQSLPDAPELEEPAGSAKTMHPTRSDELDRQASQSHAPDVEEPAGVARTRHLTLPDELDCQASQSPLDAPQLGELEAITLEAIMLARDTTNLHESPMAGNTMSAYEQYELVLVDYELPNFMHEDDRMDEDAFQPESDLQEPVPEAEIAELEELGSATQTLEHFTPGSDVIELTSLDEDELPDFIPDNDRDSDTDYELDESDDELDELVEEHALAVEIAELGRLDGLQDASVLAPRANRGATVAAYGRLELKDDDETGRHIANTARGTSPDDNNLVEVDQARQLPTTRRLALVVNPDAIADAPQHHKLDDNVELRATLLAPEPKLGTTLQAAPGASTFSLTPSSGSATGVQEPDRASVGSSRDDVTHHNRKKKRFPRGFELRALESDSEQEELGHHGTKTACLRRTELNQDEESEVDHNPDFELRDEDAAASALILSSLPDDQSIPASIGLTGSARFPYFEIRLGDYLKGCMGLSDIDMTPQNYQILHATGVDEWHKRVSAMMLPEAKSLLSQELAPTIGDLLALPEIAGEWRPGNYIELILPDPDLMSDTDELEYVYTGSATKVALGLVCRVSEHARPTYRAYEMSKKNCYHYELIDQEGKHRIQVFRKLAVTEFSSKAAAHINEVRATCIVAEQLLMSWLQCTATQSLKRNKAFLKFTPWAETEYRGANCTPPLKQDSQIALEDAEALTPTEWLKRHNKRNKQWVANMTDAQKARSKEYQRQYSEKVDGPRNRMRRAGATEHDIAEYVQKQLDDLHASLPPRTKGSNRRRKAKIPHAETKVADASRPEARP
ncbi:hypothetical protein LTR85_008812 [Meristemomyces frigidus]|nr:hypothetical protein LTR85_008812 [Meristemomyces frigidus]